MQEEAEEGFEDRISQLPEALQLEILSLLPTKDAVKTSVLSKTWECLWTDLRCLSFSARSNVYRRGSIRAFINAVDQTVRRIKQSSIDKFSVNFPYDRTCSTDVDRWIESVTRANVKELGLWLQGDFDYYDAKNIYILPQHLFTARTLTKLELRRCGIEHVGLVTWSSLRSLSLGDVSLSDDSMTRIVEGCPALEFLELYRFEGLNQLSFTNNRSLKDLVIKDIWDFGQQVSTLEISDPSIRSLAISGMIGRKKCRVMNADFLELCCLDFEFRHVLQDEEEDCESLRYMLTDLLQNLRDAKQLILGQWCVELLSLMEMQGMSSPLSKRTCLVLKTSSLEYVHFPGIANLLESSPCLEALTIRVSARRCPFSPHSSQTCLQYFWSYPKPTEEHYWRCQGRGLECLTLHLRTVDITGAVSRYGGNELLLPIAKFLLKNARVLEKMTMKAPRDAWDTLSRVAKKLSIFPRASPNAELTYLMSV